MLRTGKIALLTFAITLVSCKSEPKQSIKTENISFTKEGELDILSSKTDSIKANFDIEIAETEYETLTGLMYRKSMQQDRGMLFIQPEEAEQNFYMKNTEIPLDIIYINSGMKVVSFQKNAKPLDESSLPSRAPAKYVLEINAGLSDQLGLKVGDSISFSRN
ncbi:MAG TPA: hypothetical protein DEF18_07275 [Muricauda sp.]|mgnify:FL=1|uniref:DUF192 domain-containing protein n=1 Tax=Flagellimonas aurea TaxID=2915619 RepID=A0ABS3G3G3_9FLAO|nr:DUF192 domain-containing protein [Allomuricauda aurea]MAO18999.1 hypothetical protein [Allomuricauda sp.]MBO0353954.1 DUF192 domain-containing protein [Allomuricauda aurea]HBU77889.1 hypothetical protein [Allomuricauda sp.]|tara:strand:+ start:1195 stop:1680 length:486 start_codon:yes stop_codon:yes gene_type:complete